MSCTCLSSVRIDEPKSKKNFPGRDDDETQPFLCVSIWTNVVIYTTIWRTKYKISSTARTDWKLPKFLYHERRQKVFFRRNKDFVMIPMFSFHKSLVMRENERWRTIKKNMTSLDKIAFLAKEMTYVSKKISPQLQRIKKIHVNLLTGLNHEVILLELHFKIF